MAHTYDVTTDIGKLRLMIGDTDITPTTDAQFSDEELQVFLTMATGSLLIAAGYALEAWAASITDSLKSEKIGDYAYTMDDAGRKLEMAREYKKQDAEKPYLTWAEMDLSGVADITVEEDVE